MKTLETEVNSAEKKKKKLYKYMYSPLKIFILYPLKNIAMLVLSLVQRPWQRAALFIVPEVTVPKFETEAVRNALKCRSIQYPNWKGFFG